VIFPTNETDALSSIGDAMIGLSTLSLLLNCYGHTPQRTTHKMCFYYQPIQTNYTNPTDISLNYTPEADMVQSEKIEIKPSSASAIPRVSGSKIFPY
jgi:hypothetical protein